MSKSQQSAAPAAGSTKLFQMAERCCPVLHCTSQIQVKVAKSATTKALRPKLGKKPGRSLATFAAGCGGQPVCMANQTTQMMNAHPLKKIRVNQSIKALTLLCRVGKANAANAAKKGNDKSKTRSGGTLSMALIAQSVPKHKGIKRCRLCLAASQWCRHLQSVHKVKGQAGQVNHSHSRS